MFTRKLSRLAGVIASLATIGSAANAGGLAAALEETEIAPVVAEDPSSSIGIWPIIGLIVLGAVVATLGDDDDDDDDEPGGPPVKKK